MTTISHTQVMFKDLNERKLPNQWKFFSSRSSGGGSELNGKKMGKKGTLNENNNIFLDNLLTGYVRKILEKNKMKYIWRLETFAATIQTCRAFMIFYLSSRTKQKILLTMKLIFQTTLTFI